MGGRGTQGWRWPVAVAAFAVVVIIVVVTLLVDGLGDAANAVTVLGVIAILGSILTWGRVRRAAATEPVTRQLNLAKVLSDLTEIHGKSREAVRTALPGSDVDAILDGSVLPTRMFIGAFLKFIADGDAGILSGLEPLVWPVWESARMAEGSGDRSSSADAAVVVQITRDADIRLTLSSQGAEAVRAASRLQESATEAGAWHDFISVTLRRYATVISSLREEQARLQAELAEIRSRARDDEAARAVAAERKAVELSDVRERLARSEELKEQTRDRLEETERKLQAMVRLRDEALAEAERLRTELATLADHRIPAITLDDASGHADVPYRPMGETDQRLGEEILQRADEFLREQDKTLNRQTEVVRHIRSARSPLGRTGDPAGRPPAGPPRAATPARLRRGRYGVAIALLGIAAVVIVTLNLAPGDGHTNQPTLVAFSGQPVVLPSGSASNPDSVAFSADGSMMATGNSDGTVDLRNPATFHVTRTLAAHGAQQQAFAVAFSPDGELAAGGYSEAYISNLATGADTLVPQTNGADIEITGLAFSPDGKTLAFSDGNVYLDTLATGKVANFPFDPNNKAAEGIAFSPDSTELAVGDLNGSAYIWNLSNRTVVSSLRDPDGKGIDGVAYTPDGKYLATAGEGGNVYIWNLADRHVACVISDPQTIGNGALSIAISPNGKTLISLDNNGNGYAWNIASLGL
ncbi:MAG TPA: hypothetical protein VMU95_25175 [Trebonia sp.]|nr:hypothetical protein [Trebonia sp.]